MYLPTVFKSYSFNNHFIQESILGTLEVRQGNALDETPGPPGLHICPYHNQSIYQNAFWWLEESGAHQPGSHLDMGQTCTETQHRQQP